MCEVTLEDVGRGHHVVQRVVRKLSVVWGHCSISRNLSAVKIIRGGIRVQPSGMIYYRDFSVSRKRRQNIGSLDREDPEAS
jgi:hypothetical protein